MSIKFQYNCDGNTPTTGIKTSETTTTETIDGRICQYSNTTGEYINIPSSSVDPMIGTATFVQRLDYAFSLPSAYGYVPWLSNFNGTQNSRIKIGLENTIIGNQVAFNIRTGAGVQVSVWWNTASVQAAFNDGLFHEWKFKWDQSAAIDGSDKVVLYLDGVLQTNNYNSATSWSTTTLAVDIDILGNHYDSGSLAPNQYLDSILLKDDIVDVVPDWNLTYNLTPTNARWSTDGGTTWNNSGATVSLPEGQVDVTFEPVSGYATPASETISLTADETRSTTYIKVWDLTYNITPSTAKWSTDGGTTWNNSGATVSLPEGQVDVTFSYVVSYTTPADETFLLSADTVRSTTYEVDNDVIKFKYDCDGDGIAEKGSINSETTVTATVNSRTSQHSTAAYEAISVPYGLVNINYGLIQFDARLDYVYDTGELASYKAIAGNFDYNNLVDGAWFFGSNPFSGEVAFSISGVNTFASMTWDTTDIANAHNDGLFHTWKLVVDNTAPVVGSDHVALYLDDVYQAPSAGAIQAPWTEKISTHDALFGHGSYSTYTMWGDVYIDNITVASTLEILEVTIDNTVQGNYTPTAGFADVPLTGTYVGTAQAAMEGKVFRRDNNEVILINGNEWNTLSSFSASGGTWSGTLDSIPEYNALLGITVRYQATPDITATSQNDILISTDGILNSITTDETTLKIYPYDENNKADIELTGTYTGDTPENIEIRFADYTSDVAHLVSGNEWNVGTNISISGNVWSCTIQNVPKSNWLTATARYSNEHETYGSTAVKFGVGYMMIWSGQSNADFFHGIYNGSETALDTTRWFPNNGTTKDDWEQVTGVMLTVANDLTESLNCVVGILHYAYGGYSISEPYAFTGHFLVGSTTDFDTYINFNAALLATGTNFHNMFWYQGESDSLGVDGGNLGYETDEVAFFNQVDLATNHATSAGNIPKTVCMLGRWATGDLNPTDAGFAGVNKAKLNNYVNGYTDYILTAIDLPAAYGHITEASQILLGERLTRALLVQEGLFTTYRGPRALGYTIIDTTTIDIKLELDYGTDISPASGIDSFVVNLGSIETPNFVASTGVRIDATTVRLTHTAGTAVGVAAMYGHFGDGGSGTAAPTSYILRDNSTLASPILQDSTIPVYVEPNPVPVVTIDTPTTSDTYSTSLSSITLGGTASISGGSIASVAWVNDRGGSGVATGTTSWSQSGITLYEGANVITVTATSDLGETNTDVITVDYTVAVNPVPTISISTPTSNPTYATNSNTVDISGSASISSGSIASVGVVNDRGGSYTATGTTSWSQLGITLYEGSNVITVTATSDLGELSTDQITINYTIQVNPVPVVTIDTPVSTPTYETTSSTVSIAGTSSISDGTISTITWTNNRGGSGITSGISNWAKADIVLSVGANIITVEATSYLGEKSSDVITVIYTEESIMRSKEIVYEIDQANVGNTDFVIPFSYLLDSSGKETIFCYRNGVEEDIVSWKNPSVAVISAAVLGDTIRFVRVTPIDPIVSFKLGTVLTEDEIDKAVKQAVYIAEEASIIADGSAVYQSQVVSESAAAAASASASDAADSAELAQDTLALMGDPAAVTQAVLDSQDAAQASEDSATAASASATAAANSESAASASATSASSSSSSASTSATEAASSASASAASETAAADSAASASSSENTAILKATEASNSAIDAEASADRAFIFDPVWYDWQNCTYQSGASTVSGGDALQARSSGHGEIQFRGDGVVWSAGILTDDEALIAQTFETISRGIYFPIIVLDSLDSKYRTHICRLDSSGNIYIIADGANIAPGSVIIIDGTFSKLGI